jgi:Holliday junction resolvasome RuvABC endonuclease subunit
VTILALDLGTRCGFALRRPDGLIESGEVKLDPKAREGSGMRYVRFRQWLVEMKQCHELRELVYEQVMGHGAYQVIAAHVYGGLLATLQAFGEHHGIKYRGIGVTTVKKQFSGAGNASKADMVAQCKALGFNPATHNEADAIAVLHVAIGRCPVLTMSGATTKKRVKAAAAASI